MENLNHMIDAYTKLGGNSFVQHTIVPYLTDEVDVITHQEELEKKHRELQEKEAQLRNFKELIKVKDDFKVVLNKMEHCPFSVDPSAVKATVKRAKN